ncbi:MAG: bifunctional helix-turn-helix transcriptional regulator/GNAT family N-acetyltransferase [Candidatus Thorarchaeota archaeon]
MLGTKLEEHIHDIRKFNRLYTKKIGLLNKGLLKTRFPLSQARVIFELAQQDGTKSSDIARELGIDSGYLSRILTSFEKDGLISKEKSSSDSRKWILRLTSKGQEIFQDLNGRASEEIREMIEPLSCENQYRLVNAMRTIENLLNPKSHHTSSILIRQPRAGDIGWIAHRHGVVYSDEYGWDETFEALTAEILAKFVQNHDSKRERIWIAEQNGEKVGSVMIVDNGNQVAKLRLFLVEPKARGGGIGKSLIEECIDFSRRNGYKKITLWTQNNLLAARHLYSKYGFELVDEEPTKMFGYELVSEVWELKLRK